MTRRNLILIVGGVGLVVFALLGLSRGDEYYSPPDRLLAAAGAVLIVWGVIDAMRGRLVVKTQLQSAGSRQDRGGEAPEGRWCRHKIVSVEGDDILCFVFVCLEDPYVGRPEVMYCQRGPEDATLEALYHACGYPLRPGGRNPQCVVGCEVYARPVGGTGLKEFRSVTEPLPIK